MSANDGRLAASGEGVVMPRALTAENGAKAALIGEFSEQLAITCPNGNDCGDSDCEYCAGFGVQRFDVDVTWATIKAIYAAAVKHFHPEAGQ